MAEYLDAGQCIGCGRLESPQTCIGICQDRKVQFVSASEYEQVLEEANRCRREAMALTSLIRQLALTTPHNGRWERTYLALQVRARKLLAARATAKGETNIPEA